MNDNSWCRSQVIQYNYFHTNLTWNCIQKAIEDGMTTLFWYNNWLEGQAPMNLWPEEFSESVYPRGIVRDIIVVFTAYLPHSNLVLQSMRQRISSPIPERKNK